MLTKDAKLKLLKESNRFVLFCFKRLLLSFSQSIAAVVLGSKKAEKSLLQHVNS